MILMGEIPTPGYLVSTVKVDSEGHSISLEHPQSFVHAHDSPTSHLCPKIAWSCGPTQSHNLKHVLFCFVFNIVVWFFVDDNIVLQNPKAGSCLEPKRIQVLGP